jgi:membrane protein DedA with SNARE-associated domain
MTGRIFLFVIMASAALWAAILTTAGFLAS